MSGNNALLPYVRVKVFLSPFRGYLKATSFGRGCLLLLKKLYIFQVFFRKCQEQGLRNLENKGVYFRK